MIADRKLLQAWQKHAGARSGLHGKWLGPWPRQTCFTDRGIARLLARDYSVFYRGPIRGPGWRPKLRERPLETYGPHDRRMRLEHSVALAFQRYLELGGYAVPNCPCMVHSFLKVPADYIAAVCPPNPRKGEGRGGRVAAERSIVTRSSLCAADFLILGE